MNQTRELQQLIGHRAELIERMKGRLDSVEVALRLTCLDDEIRKAQIEAGLITDEPKPSTSVFAKTRAAVRRIIRRKPVKSAA
jgi:hypothetical protein